MCVGENETAQRREADMLVFGVTAEVAVAWLCRVGRRRDGACMNFFFLKFFPFHLKNLCAHGQQRLCRILRA